MEQRLQDALCEDTIVINVGGTRHETRLSTLRRWPLTKLANDKVLQQHYRPKSGDFYFDRHPGKIFCCVPSDKLCDLDKWWSFSSGIQMNKILFQKWIKDLPGSVTFYYPHRIFLQLPSMFM